MTLRQISDKILIKSIAGQNPIDIGAPQGLSAGGQNNLLPYLLETSPVNSEYQIFDGFSIPRTNPLSLARTGTKITAWSLDISHTTDLFAIASQEVNGLSQTVLVLELISTSTFNSISRIELDILSTGAFPFVQIIADEFSNEPGTAPHFCILYASDASATFKYIYTDNAGTVQAGPFTLFVLDPTKASLPNAIGATSDDPILVLVKETGGLNATFITQYSLDPVFGGPSGFSVVRTNVSAPNVTSVPSPSYRDGVASISPTSATTVKRYIVYQQQISPITLAHEIRVKIGPPPFQGFGADFAIFTSVPTPGKTAEQACRTSIFISPAGRMVIALETLDYPGPNSKILLVDLNTQSTIQTIDLGAPGPVRIYHVDGYDAQKIHVYHQEVTAGSSDIYARVLWLDDWWSGLTNSNRLALTGEGQFQLSDRTTSSLDVTQSHIVSAYLGHVAGTLPDRPNITGYLLSETQSTRPDTSDPNFVSTTLPFSPTFPTVTLSPGWGIKKVYAWTKNSTTTSLFPYNSTMFVDPVQFFSLRDRLTGSTVSADSAVVSVSISTDPDVTGFLLSETITAFSAAQNASFAPLPNTYSLSQNAGLKTIYLWVRNLSTIAAYPTIRTISLTTTEVDVSYQTSGLLLATRTSTYATSANILATDLTRSHDSSAILSDLITPSILLQDRVFGDLAFTRDHVVSVTFNPDAQSGTGWLLSETQSTKPSISNTHFVTTLPQSFGLGTILDPVNGEGQLRTVYCWVKDNFGVMHSVPATDEIFLGNNPTCGISLTDRTSSSQILTDERVISVSITALPQIFDGTVAEFFISETQTIQPAWNNTSFAVTSPQTFQLSAGDGLKTAYVWVKNRYAVSNILTSDSITLQSALPSNSFTYIIKHGNNVIGPSINPTNPIKAGHFLAPGDFMFFQNQSGSLGTVIGSSITNPELTMALDAGIGYLLIINSIPTGQVRTVSFVGPAWSN